MADLTITQNSVVPGSAAIVVSGTLGAAVGTGAAVYKSSTTGFWLNADNNAATAEERTCTGICLNGGASGQPTQILIDGPITIGATMTAGVAYYLSDTAGGICPYADIGSGEYVCFLGISTSTTVLNFKPIYSGVAL